MSQNLFTRTPALRHAARRAFPRPSASSTASYHHHSAPKMPSGTAPIRNLLRQTTLRATAIAAQRTSLPVSQHFSHQSYTSRSRSPSPPPPYQARGTSVLAAPNQWTRFSTPYTLSSVRTFSSAPRIHWPADAAAGSALSSEAQKMVEEAIEEITELYGTAKDEFEIASEETEKNTTYAEDDRAAAREELDRLLEFYQGVVEGEDRGVGEEVKRRVGQRIRELEQAVLAMEEEATHHD
ncbi:hypothetical protein IQ07DRAFT_585831 [Pyrenochaeta sp. DS3sAY3a]|nr:hypothetical protein IQ07DRAFT_585831 [Pyrenochaeta sp. DS3sAY3a]